MEDRIGRDWSRYWRAVDRPVEAMYAGFRRHTYARHSHDAYSFGVTESGAQAFTCRGASRTSAAGMVMTFNPDEPHDGYPATSDGFVYRIVHIGPDLVSAVLADATAHPVGLPLFPEPVVTDPRLARAVRRLHAALLGGADPLTRDERLTTAILAIATSAPRHPVHPATAHVSHQALSRVRDTLVDHVRTGAGAPLDADTLATVAGCSRHALYRAFQQVHGMSPSAYHRQLRLRTARTLIANGIPIAEAAHRTSFADQAHLTRWFVRTYGITPATYARA